MEKDKKLHMGACFAIAYVSTKVLRKVGVPTYYAIPLGFGVAMGIGFAKEAWDALGHGTPDMADILADLAGASIGSVVGAIDLTEDYFI